MKAGVVDPTKVTRSALQNAASISGLLLTTEAVITELPEKEKPAAGGDIPAAAWAAWAAWTTEPTPRLTSPAAYRAQAEVLHRKLNEAAGRPQSRPAVLRLKCRYAARHRVKRWRRTRIFVRFTPFNFPPDLLMAVTTEKELSPNAKSLWLKATSAIETAQLTATRSRCSRPCSRNRRLFWTAGNGCAARNCCRRRATRVSSRGFPVRRSR